MVVEFEFVEELEEPRRLGGGNIKFIDGRIVREEKPYMPTLSPQDVERILGKERATKLEKMFERFKGLKK